MTIRVGFGYDIHQFSEGRELHIGGVQLEHEMGLLGHSDADVLLHAVMDAMLGAANMRDIGFHFPDTSADYKGADSKELAKQVAELIKTKGYSLVNVDATVCMERPKLNPYIPAIQEKMSQLLGVDTDAISIKATTSEKMGFVGQELGAKAYAVVLLEKS
ncbi:MAG TPA: 2-C-methyl-D-erythritol 2,4-cyclodiphosphate synthase [Flavobacteriales bacterium]|nr:2-C-methyl-D-erythritol 2,4-cyclodiphosphate synthase [Flavobacteriales bacterium]